MNYKYVAILDQEGCDVNDPSRYLPPHNVSQKQRDKDYDRALALIEEFEWLGRFAAHNYLNGDDDCEPSEEDMDALLASRYSADHTRENRRNASLDAKTKKIALGMPEGTKEYRKTLGVTECVYQRFHDARRLLDADAKARISIHDLKEKLNTEEITGQSLDRHNRWRNYYESFLLSFPGLIVKDTEDGKGHTEYERDDFSEYDKCVRSARRGKSVLKLAKHYDVFSPQERRFVKKSDIKPEAKAPQEDVVVRGPKKFWTQEEIAAAKALENLPAHRRPNHFVRSSHIIVQDKSFGKRSSHAKRNLTASNLILVPRCIKPFIYSDVLRGSIM